MILTPIHIFGRWEGNEEITPEIRKNAEILCAKVSELLSHYGKDLKISSGFRPRDYNKQVGGSNNSSHCFGMAVDLYDPSKEFGRWCVLNIDLLREIVLYMESLTCTHISADKSWVHLQSRPSRTGNIIFIP